MPSITTGGLGLALALANNARILSYIHRKFFGNCKSMHGACTYVLLLIKWKKWMIPFQFRFQCASKKHQHSPEKKLKRKRLNSDHGTEIRWLTRPYRPVPDGSTSAYAAGDWASRIGGSTNRDLSMVIRLDNSTKDQSSNVIGNLYV